MARENGARPNQTCFRYSQMIDKLIGKAIEKLKSSTGKEKVSLNDAVEHIILDYYNTEKERKTKIGELDKIIKQKEAHISKLQDKEKILSSIEAKLSYIERDVKDIGSYFKDIKNDIKKMDED